MASLKRLASMPWVSLSLSALMLIGYSWQIEAIHLGLMPFLIRDMAFNWTAFQHQVVIESPRLLSYTFIHADLSHLVSNLIFFICFSFFVESLTGPIMQIILYFGGAAIAAIAQGFIEPFTASLIGASGAISSVGGAFFVLAPQRFSLKTMLIPYILLLVWYVSEIMHQGSMYLGPEKSIEVTTIAHVAHLGGFLWGALCSFIWTLIQKRRA